MMIFYKVHHILALASAQLVAAHSRDCCQHSVDAHVVVAEVVVVAAAAVVVVVDVAVCCVGFGSGDGGFAVPVAVDPVVVAAAVDIDCVSCADGYEPVANLQDRECP